MNDQDYEFVGSKNSYYSAKVRACLQFKRLPYHEVCANADTILLVWLGRSRRVGGAEPRPMRPVCLGHIGRRRAAEILAASSASNTSNHF